MKKAIFAVGMYSIMFGTSHAQSSVTLYGQVDAEINYANNIQTVARSSSGRPAGGSQIGLLDNAQTGLSSSRWGLKGVEDLGGGLTAIFNLENGFNVNNGELQNGGAEFGRVAFVGLSSPSYGTFTMGRQGDTSVTFVSPLTFEWDGGNMAIHPADYDDLEFTRHLNNTLKYISPLSRGFQFGGMYSVGGVAGDFTASQIWSIGATYSVNSLSVAASVNDAKNPNNSYYGANPSATATGNNMGSAGSATTPEANPSIAGFASAGYQRTITAAAKYTLGNAIIGVGYSNAQFGNLDSDPSLNTLNYSGSTTLSTYDANFRYYVTPQVLLGTSYDYTHGGAVGQKGSATYQQVNLLAGYLLSKATGVYLSASYQHASGTNSLGQPAVAAIGYLTPSATDEQTTVAVSIRHLF
jgi:predicted porin